MKRLVTKINFAKLFRSISIATVLSACFDSAFADQTIVVNTTSDLRNNVAIFLHSITGVATSIAVLAGLALLFSGIMSLYGSHVKKGAGGKPPAHGVTLLGCGAILIGLPGLFLIAANTFWGHKTTTIGQKNGAMYQIYGQIVGQNDMD